MKIRELLREFSHTDPLRVKLTGIVSQLKARQSDSGAKKPMNVDALLSIMNNEGLGIEESDLRDMINRAPLKNIIRDIKGDEVIFKGMVVDKKNSKMSVDSAKKILDKMSHKAADNNKKK